MYFSHIFYCLLHTRLGEKIKMNYFEIVVLMLHVQSEFNRNQGKTILCEILRSLEYLYYCCLHEGEGMSLYF